MSDSGWIRTLAGGLLILMISVGYSKGSVELCSFCCIIEAKREDLHCMWSSHNVSQHTAALRSLTRSQDPPRRIILQPGQNWLVIPRENLTHFHKYQLRVSGGGRDEALSFTYSHDGENVFISPPTLNSSILEDGKTVDLTWEYPYDHSDYWLVELRYRILGDSSWTVVNSDILEPTAYELADLEPDAKYEFQIRCLPDENLNNQGSLWSESHVITTPEDVPTGNLDIWRSLEKWPLLLIMWKPLNPRSARGKILSYHVVFNGNNTTEVPCCSTILPAQTTHVCVGAKNSKGLGNYTCVTTLCSDTSVFGGKAWGDEAGRINVWWEEPLDSRLSLSYVVEWNEDGNKQINWTRSQAANKTLILPGEFTPGVVYHVSVFAINVSNCVAQFSTETYSLDEVPSAGPNFTIDVLTATEAFISWDEIPVQHRRGNLKHYTIYANSAESSQQYTVYSTNKTLSGLSSGIVYTVWMTATTTAGEGPPGTEMTFQPTGHPQFYHHSS
ncbi:interleukin-27 receptor subunit alpha isoform X2 [Mixophyes fleayi]|uniref:interleukin-27 receptor subunit alpha isoform X2 n=1 Tax=Mixophyes fleayi TaxID=3061075 RepID=UPI003F4DCD30